jgi:hypothetical protein
MNSANAVAKSVMPSLEEATPDHDLAGAAVCTHEAPESVLVKITPAELSLQTATTLLPLADAAMPVHSRPLRVCSHDAPLSALV